MPCFSEVNAWEAARLVAQPGYFPAATKFVPLPNGDPVLESTCNDYLQPALVAEVFLSPRLVSLEH